MSRLSVVLALALLAMALLTPAPAFAADPVVIDIRVAQPQDTTIGDHVRYTVRLQADPGTSFDIPPGSMPAVIELIARPQVSERRVNATMSEFTVTFVVAPFFPGELEVEPITLTYSSPTGATGQVLTPASTIVVRSLLPQSGSPQPRDLKPQAVYGDPPTNLLRPAATAVAILAVLGIALFAWRRRRQRLAATPLESEVVELGPEDRARRLLDGLVPALQQGDLPAYYAGLSETVRVYLTERFGFPAFALTTSELQQRMLQHGLDRWQARLVSGLLTECDSVLYAHYRPAPERSDANLSAAYEIVEISRPESMSEPEVEVAR